MGDATTKLWNEEHSKADACSAASGRAAVALLSVLAHLAASGASAPGCASPHDVAAEAASGGEQETCVEAYGTTLPTQVIAGELTVGDFELRNNVWGMAGHANDNFRQCLFTNGGELGWTWIKGTTDFACTAPQGQTCPAIFCMYQFSFPSLSYGVDPWGGDTGAPDMPLNLGELQSLVISHDVTYEAIDDLPGQRGGVLFPLFPPDIYPRHSLIYDLFLTVAKPQAGTNVSESITDEVIIMMNDNAEYPDIEACSITVSPPIEANAVFDGFHQYDYHSFDDQNVFGQNYHQFRRVGGSVTGAAVPQSVDLAPFLRYLKQRYDLPDLWLGQIVIGTQLYDHTHGDVTFHSEPDFAIAYGTCGDELVGVSEDCDDGALNGTARSCCAADCQYKPNGNASCDGNPCTRPDTCTDGACTPGSCADSQACSFCGATCVDTGSTCECQ